MLTLNITDESAFQNPPPGAIEWLDRCASLREADEAAPVPANASRITGQWIRRYGQGFFNRHVARVLGVDAAIFANHVMYSHNGLAYFGWQYMAAHYGWTRDRYARTRKVLREAGILLEMGGRGGDQRIRMRVDEDAFEAIEKQGAEQSVEYAQSVPALAWLLRPFEVLEVAEDEPAPPVDNFSDSQGLPLQQNPAMPPNPGLTIAADSSNQCGNLQHSVNREAVNSTPSSNSLCKPARAADVQTPSDEAEKDEPPPTPPEQSDRAAAILIAFMVKADIPHDPERVRHVCALNSITPYAAHETTKLAQASKTPIRAWAWFTKTLPTVPKTPPPANTTRNGELLRMDSIRRETRSAPELAEGYLADALAAAKRAGRKAGS